jgi:anti-anti-sigma factor
MDRASRALRAATNEGEGHMKAQEPGIEFEVPQPGTAIVKLRGELDISTRARLAGVLAGASTQTTVLVDLSECTFADSSLVAALVTASAEVRKRGGRLELVIPPTARAPRRLAELARLADIVPIHESHMAACANL